MRSALKIVLALFLMGAMGCANVPIEAGDPVDQNPGQALAAPSIPTNLTLTGVTPYSATLAWEAPYGSKTPILKYEIQINNDGDPSVIRAPDTSKELIRLDAESSYDFKIRACSDNVTCSEYSENISINTLAAPDTIAPSVPSGLMVTGATQSSIAISWNASTDNTGVSRYEIQTNSTGTPATVMAPTTSRNTTGLSASTTYQFRVRACDASNNCSAYTSNISGTTSAAPDTTAPSVPTGLASGTITNNAIAISWNASTDNVGVTRYEIQTNSTGNPVTVNAPTTNRNMTGLSASTTYQFRVRACDASNNCSAYTSNISPMTMSAADTTAPTMPTGLAVGTITSGSISLSWNASTDNVGVARYEVQTNSTGTPVAVSAPTRARTMTGLNASTTYQFRVRACDVANNCSSYTSNVSGMTLVEAAAATVPGTLASKKAVSMYATVQDSPAKITVKWAKVSGVNQSSASLFRRSKGTSSWGSAIATFGNNTYSYEDTSVVVGTTYEYKMQLSNSVGTAYGYLTSGINVAAPTFNGKIVVVVDNSLYANISVAQMSTLQGDLFSDGWIPSFIFVNRTDSATSVRNQIKAIYDADTANVKAVLLVGHVPVPYSGTSLAPDGHPEHSGAWPADGYYGEMTSTWTQGGGNVWGGFAAGDRNGTPLAASKFSHNTFPSSVELQVGRIDFYNMPTFSQSELQLTNNYLTKARNFKRGLNPATKRAHIGDNLEWANAPFSLSAWSNVTSAVGPTNITASYYGTANYVLGTNQSYLWGYAAGGGSIVSADAQGTTTDFANNNFDMVFNMFFGSYFGDFDMKNDFLRAVIASPGKALTNVYSGAQQFYAQDMAMGGTIGYSMAVSQTNTDSNYAPAYGGCCGSGNAYLNLMGDPTLRQSYPQAPLNLTASGNNLNWTAASGSIDGYNVYQITGSTITKLNSNVITGTTFNVASGVAGKHLMVRAVRTETTNAGSYEALSLGARNSF